VKSNFFGFLKHYFIPHEGNDHKPHFLRRKTVFLCLSGVIFCEAIFLLNVYVFIPYTNFFASILPNVLVDVTNTMRAEQKEKTLVLNQTLADAARMKAEDMATEGYFAHTSPDGVTPWYWLDRAGYAYSYAGENLAINFIDSEDVVDAWMKSTKHRENILNEKFTEIGIGTARGIYKGHETVFVVQMFGRPMGSVLPVARASISESETIQGIQSEDIDARVLAVTKKSESAEFEAYAKNATLFMSTLTKPRTVFDYIFLAFAGLVMIALLLKIFIKIHIQHPHLVVHGMILLVVVGFVMAINQYIGFSAIKIL